MFSVLFCNNAVFKKIKNFNCIKEVLSVFLRNFTFAFHGLNLKTLKIIKFISKLALGRKLCGRQ